MSHELVLLKSCDRNDKIAKSSFIFLKFSTVPGNFPGIYVIHDWQHLAYEIAWIILKVLDAYIKKVAHQTRSNLHLFVLANLYSPKCFDGCLNGFYTQTLGLFHIRHCPLEIRFYLHEYGLMIRDKMHICQYVCAKNMLQEALNTRKVILYISFMSLTV